MIRQKKKNQLTPRFNKKLLIAVYRNRSCITVEYNFRHRITHNASYFKRISKPLDSESAGESNSDIEANQSDNAANNEGDKRPNIFKENQLVMITRDSNRLHKQPEGLGEPILSALV